MLISEAIHSSSSHPSRIVIIDDDPELAQLYRNYLNQFDEYECNVIYPSVTAFLTAIPDGDPPEIVLLDIGLPDLRGDIGMKNILQRLPEVKIIMITIHREPEIVIHSILAGAKAFFYKGESLTRLAKIIEIVRQNGIPLYFSLAMYIYNRRNTVPFKADEIQFLKNFLAGQLVFPHSPRLNPEEVKAAQIFKTIVEHFLSCVNGQSFLPDLW